jgi:glutamate racemase
MNDWNNEVAAQQSPVMDTPRPRRDSERSTELLVHEWTRYSRRTEAAIGVFDSGAGGLTILSALLEELPEENFVYLGDTAKCPYGVRSNEEITELTLAACRFLVQHGVKLIVLACNTASQAALSTLRSTMHPLPFVGVVPAVKPAARLTKNGRIGIAATNQAARAIYLRQLIDEFAGGINVFATGCPDLVTLVEHGQFAGPEVEEIVRRSLWPVLAEDIDVLVLGCTHFPVLRPVIEHVAGHRVQVIDSGFAIARRTRAVLHTEGLLVSCRSRNAAGGNVEIWCSGDPEAFSPIARTILGLPISARQTEPEVKEDV